jgi:hypothetical protein
MDTLWQHAMQCEFRCSVHLADNFYECLVRSSVLHANIIAPVERTAESKDKWKKELINEKESK